MNSDHSYCRAGLDQLGHDPEEQQVVLKGRCIGEVDSETALEHLCKVHAAAFIWGDLSE